LMCQSNLVTVLRAGDEAGHRTRGRVACVVDHPVPPSGGAPHTRAGHAPVDRYGSPGEKFRARGCVDDCDDGLDVCIDPSLSRPGARVLSAREEINEDCHQQADQDEDDQETRPPDANFPPLAALLGFVANPEPSKEERVDHAAHAHQGTALQRSALAWTAFYRWLTLSIGTGPIVLIGTAVIGFVAQRLTRHNQDEREAQRLRDGLMSEATEAQGIQCSTRHGQAGYRQADDSQDASAMRSMSRLPLNLGWRHCDGQAASSLFYAIDMTASAT
jgi:hypothetical protein